MKDKWMNIGYEGEELQPYHEPEPDLNDDIRIRKHYTVLNDIVHTCTCICLLVLQLVYVHVPELSIGSGLGSENGHERYNYMYLLRVCNVYVVWEFPRNP